MIGPVPLGPERKASRQEIGKNKIGHFQDTWRSSAWAARRKWSGRWSFSRANFITGETL